MTATTMPRKNVYIREADMPLVQEFEEAGGSVSDLFSKALQGWKAEQDAINRLGDFQRIEVEVTDEVSTNESEVRAFTGRWLVYPGPVSSMSDDENFIPTTCYGIAQTAKGAFVGVTGTASRVDDGYGPFDVFEVVQDLDDLPDGYRFPWDIIERAKAKLSGVREMDI